jgi:hypothetical protein
LIRDRSAAVLPKLSLPSGQILSWSGASDRVVARHRWDAGRQHPAAY